MKTAILNSSRSFYIYNTRATNQADIDQHLEYSPAIFFLSSLTPEIPICHTYWLENSAAARFVSFSHSLQESSSFLLEYNTFVLHSITRSSGFKWEGLGLRKFQYVDYLKFFRDTVDIRWLEHWQLVYYRCSESVLESLGKNPITADLW